MLLHDARRDRPGRRRGDLVTLEDQDRTRWDRGQIDEGVGAAGPRRCGRGAARGRTSSRRRSRPATPTAPDRGRHRLGRRSPASTTRCWALAVAGRRAQPRGRRGDGRRSGRRAGAGGRAADDRRARRLPPAAGDPRRPAAPARPDRRGAAAYRRRSTSRRTDAEARLLRRGSASSASSASLVERLDRALVAVIRQASSSSSTTSSGSASSSRTAPTPTSSWPSRPRRPRARSPAARPARRGGP